MNKRNSNIELLRIIAMLLILACHFVAFIPWQGIRNCSGWRKVTILLIDKGFGQTGVCLFFLITGFFLVEQKFKWQRISRTIIQTLCYSVAILILCRVIYSFSPSYFGSFFAPKSILSTLWRFILPTINGTYWFVSAYVLLLLFHPYINKLLKILTQKEKIHILILLGVVSVIPLFSEGLITWNSWLYALLGYWVGALIRTESTIILWRIPTSLCCVGIGASLVFLWGVYWFNLVRPGIMTVWGWKEIAGSLVPPIPVFIASLLFLLVLKSAEGNRKTVLGCHPRLSSLICRLASTVFGNYLLHYNLILRNLLWGFVGWIVPEPSGLMCKIAVSVCTIVVLFLILSVCAFCIDYIIVRPIERLFLNGLSKLLVRNRD